MKIACLSFTNDGKKIGEKIAYYSTINKENLIHHYFNKEVQGGIKKVLEDFMQEYDGLVFICATGIAVRMINPYIKHKTIDPAVVVVDDLGRFSISLLSGHIGGANQLAKWIAEIIGALPVITTASDGRGIESIDIFSIKNNYYMENMISVKNITSMMLDDKKIGFYSEMDNIIKYDKLVFLNNLKDINKDVGGLIAVTSIEKIYTNIPYTILRPKNINIGIGCRRGVEAERIIQAIKESLSFHNISLKSIKAIGTIEIKKDEKGIIEAAKYFDCPLKIFTIDEIKEVEQKFEKSQFVKDTIGVYSVSGPCAYLLGGNIVSEKSKHNGITISITKEEKNG